MNNYIDNALLYNYDTLPPEDVVSVVNPFSRHIRFIIIGLALWIIKLNFFNLNYILPLAGILLLMAGFRALRKENRYFSACFAVTLFLLAEFSETLIINTTIFHQEIYQSPLMIILTIISTTLSFLLFFCLGMGIKVLQQKASLPQKTSSTVALIIWYALLYALALINYNGIVIGVIMLIAFAGILISLHGISKELDEAGYMLTPSVFKIPNWAICSIVCLTIAVGGICGYTFFGKYDMQWQQLSPTKFESVKAHLSSLGFPDSVLNDLTESDLAECENAIEVKVKSALHSANEGREVVTQTTLQGRKTYIRSTVYDQKELCITSVAVKLPTERTSWKIFHHFSWQITPSFYGTECIRIIPAYNILGWSNKGSLSGRILYDNGSMTYTAPYASLGTYTRTADDGFFTQSTSDDIYATFSFPHSGTNHRGYVCYIAAENQPGWMLSSWIDYTHQKNFFQYPNQTAMDNTLKSFLNKSDAFISMQDAIQFLPE